MTIRSDGLMSGLAGIRTFDFLQQGIFSDSGMDAAGLAIVCFANELQQRLDNAIGW